MTPESLKKGIPQSSLGGAFDFEKYQYWRMVCQNENEEGPKRVMKERVEALKWIGKAMEKTKGDSFGRRSLGDSYSNDSTLRNQQRVGKNEGGVGGKGREVAR